MAASSYGVGMQLKNAIDLGFKHFIIGLGGSGMCDGGAGALAALGVAFYDRNGTSIPHPTGGDLQWIERLQIPLDFQRCVKGMHFTYACDVTNPYTGENGAAAVFGPQKGATPAQVQLLNNGMAHLAALLPNAVSALPGAGAAGGLCGGLYGVLGGSSQSGFDLLAALAAACEGESLITGTSRLAHKESDRAETLREEYAKVGIEIDLSTPDVMRIRGGAIRPARVFSHGDHRIAMSMAVSALRSSGAITIEGAEAVAKSYPRFFEDLESLRVN